MTIDKLSTVAFSRYARLVIDRIEIVSRGIADQTGLRFDFDVSKNLKPEPNKAQINIWGLSRGSRYRIQTLGSVPVSLDVGYEGGHEQIFLGGLRTALPTKDDEGSIIVHLASGDGEVKFRKSRVSASFAKGTPANQVLRTVAEAIGVDRGNLDEAVSALQGVANAFPSGTVLHGNAARELTGVCRSLGLEWSVQNGKLQILSLGALIKGTAINLSESSGMIGAPSLDSKGVLSVKSLLVPGIHPGRALVIKSEFLSGQFRIEETKHSGDTRGQNWIVDIKAKRY